MRREEKKNIVKVPYLSASTKEKCTVNQSNEVRVVPILGTVPLSSNERKVYLYHKSE